MKNSTPAHTPAPTPAHPDSQPSHATTRATAHTASTATATASTTTANTAKRSFPTVLLAALVAVFLVAATVIATIGILNSITAARTPRAQQATTTVKSGVVKHTLNATIISVPLASQSVSAQGTVTRNGAAKGASIKEGGLVSVVDERPIMVLQGSIPMYRALGRGASGADVTQLQEALRRLGYSIGDAAGTFGPATSTAVSNLYTALGFPFVDASGAPLPQGSRHLAGIPQQELVFLASLPARADAACGVTGAQANGTLCTLSTQKSTRYIKVLSTLLEGINTIEGLSVTAFGTSSAIGTVGAEVAESALSGGSAEGSGTNTSAAAGTGGSNAGGDSSASASANASAGTLSGSASQYRYFAFTAAKDAKLSDDSAEASVTITVATSEKSGLILPSIALQSGDGDGSASATSSTSASSEYWVEAQDGKRIQVTVGFCYGGECTVSGSGLTDGLTVLLPQAASAATSEAASAE